MIGFIVPDIANPVWALIIEVVEDVLAEYGFKLIIVNTKEDSSRELENIHLLFRHCRRRHCGIYLSISREIQAVIPSDFLIVLIDRTLKTPIVTASCFKTFPPFMTESVE